MTHDISVIGIAYNSAAVLPGFLDSVPPGVPSIVVDNASGDGSTDIAERHGARLPL